MARRTQPIRKAFYALIILAVFMIVLRISRPAPATIDLHEIHATGKQQQHGDELSHDLNKGHAEPVAAQADYKQKAEKAHKNVQAEEIAKVETVDKGEKQQEEHVDDYDAEAAYNKIVEDPGSPTVIIFSKSYCPHSARAKSLLLEAYNIKPEPRVVELDQISHGAELQAYIHSKTGRRTVPNILINGVSRGGASDMLELDLIQKFTEWGNGKLTIAARQTEIQN